MISTATSFVFFLSAFLRHFLSSWLLPKCEALEFLFLCICVHAHLVNTLIIAVLSLPFTKQRLHIGTPLSTHTPTYIRWEGRVFPVSWRQPNPPSPAGRLAVTPTQYDVHLCSLLPHVTCTFHVTDLCWDLGTRQECQYYLCDQPSIKKKTLSTSK